MACYCQEIVGNFFHTKFTASFFLFFSFWERLVSHHTVPLRYLPQIADDASSLFLHTACHSLLRQDLCQMIPASLAPTGMVMFHALRYHTPHMVFHNSHVSVFHIQLFKQFHHCFPRLFVVDLFIINRLLFLKCIK